MMSEFSQSEAVFQIINIYFFSIVRVCQDNRVLKQNMFTVGKYKCAILIVPSSELFVIGK